MARRRARLIETPRIRGGFRGLLSALAAWLDPDAPHVEAEHRLARSSGADQRRRDLRAHRAERQALKRSPF